MIHPDDHKQAELKDMAQKLGLEFKGNASKAELADLINAARKSQSVVTMPTDTTSPVEAKPLPLGQGNDDLKKHPKFAKFKQGDKHL